MAKRIIETEIQKEEQNKEVSLRPLTLKNYIGQENIKKAVTISIDAAKARGEALDHILLYGPPGLGKTTLATILANEMGSKIKITSGPAIEKPGEIAAILNSLNEGDILFIDEIHRLNRQVEEVLYPAMEDFVIDIILGKDQSSNAKSVRLSLPKFTLVGATTRAGLLSAPLRDRFGEIHRLEFYTPEELTTIILNSSKVMDFDVDYDSAMAMALRSRGTPRLANRMLKRVRDYSIVCHNGEVSPEITKEALDLVGIDQNGLDETDRRLLLTIIEKFSGGPVGLDTLSAAIGEDPGTVEDVYEPYLIKNGFINRTPKGRVATALCYEYLGLEKP